MWKKKWCYPNRMEKCKNSLQALLSSNAKVISVFSVEHDDDTDVEILPPGDLEWRPGKPLLTAKQDKKCK